MITKTQFYNSFNRNSPDNPKRIIGSVDAKYILRDLSLNPAYMCAKLQIPANTITLLFLGVSLLGNYLFTFPSVYLSIISILLFEFAQLLDCVDGQLARYYGSFSYYGHILDNFSHTLISSSFMIAFGYRVFQFTDNYTYLIISSFGAISFAFCNLWYDIPNLEKLDEKKTHNRFINSLLIKIYTLTDEIRFFMIVIVVASFVPVKFAKLSFLELILISHVFFTLVDKVIYRFYLVITQPPKLTSIWKGWK